MGVLAWSGVTWGISGPFWLIFGVLVLVDVIGSVVMEQMMSGGGRTAVDKLDERPHDIAYLNGGPELAVLSALSSMRVAGTIVAEGQGQVRAAEELATHTSELEGVIHQVAGTPITRDELPTNPVVFPALKNIRRRLEDAGLLLSAEQQFSIKRTGQSMWAINLLGVVVLIVTLINDSPVDFLPALELLVIYLLSYVMMYFRVRASNVPERSRRGTAALKALRLRYTEFTPSTRPNEATYESTHAELGVALLDISTLLASAPAFVAEVNAEQAAAGTGEAAFGSGSTSGSSSGDAGGESYGDVGGL